VLANPLFHIRKNTPKLSCVFWLCTALGYGVGILGLISILLADLSSLDAKGAVGESAVFHLSVVRLIIISVTLIVFPVLLFTSLRHLLYFIIGITAWASMVYLDDVLVLYKFIQYPQSAAIKAVMVLRPFAIIGLLWMCFELQMRLKNGS